MRDRNYKKKTYNAWNIFRKNSKNLGALYYKRYIQKIARKCIFSLRMNVAMNKEYVRTVALQIEKQTGDPDAFLRFVFRITRLQAKVRAIRQRTKFAEQKVQMLYSIQVLQNFLRTCLARKEFAGRYRKNEIIDRAKEDMELDLMREEEVIKRYYDYRVRAIVNFQRIFRGWKGRMLAAEVAVLFYRDQNRDFYQQSHTHRLRHEAFKRAAIARENHKNKSAAQIQKRVRGMQARKRFRVLQHKALVAKNAVYVQREYRRHRARMKLLGMRRDKKSELRFAAARKQRGSVMRMMGFRTRAHQAIFGKALEEIGMEPLSFNYRIGELIAETVADFKFLVGVFKRERALFEELGYSTLSRAMGRRKVLAQQGWKLKVYDAVKIVEKGHKYQGFTGTISRIDENLLGVPLYEIKLDRVAKQTFVRMTTDAFVTYNYTQPLSKIQRKPALVEYEPIPAIFGIDPEDPFFSKANVNAAWTVQRAFRVFRAKKIASRKRYELWLRSSARQFSLLYHLAETNTMTTQAYNVAGIFKIRPQKPVFYDEIRHPFMPPRLTKQVARESEKVSIQREFEYRARDRIAYLQKAALISGKEYFSTGYEKMTFNRKLRILSNFFSFGFKSKRPATSQDVPTGGARGIKAFSRQPAMVTGMDKFSFEQFHGSPHVRYYKVMTIYSFFQCQSYFKHFFLCTSFRFTVFALPRRMVGHSPHHAPPPTRPGSDCLSGRLGLRARRQSVVSNHPALSLLKPDGYHYLGPVLQHQLQRTDAANEHQVAGPQSGVP